MNNDFETDAGMKPGELATYLQPWAKKLMDSRKAQDEPYTACLPMAPPPAVHPYPWRIVQSYTWRGMTHIFIIHENGDSGAHRQIFMDGRKHPARTSCCRRGSATRSAGGRATRSSSTPIGYNGKNWYDQKGMPYTDQLHTIERYTRPNYGTMVDNVTIEDPGRIHPADQPEAHGHARASRHRTVGVHLPREQSIWHRWRLQAGHRNWQRATEIGGDDT